MNDGGYQSNPDIVSAVAAAALTIGQNVVLSLAGSVQSGALTATAAGAGDRVDGVVNNNVASGGAVSITLLPGRKIMTTQSDAAITAGSAVYSGASGQATATANGMRLGFALHATSAASQQLWIIADAVPALAKDFHKVASAGDATNGYIEFTHTFGSNALVIGYAALNGSTGAPRTVASVTHTSTSVTRITVTSLAANDTVGLRLVKASV